MVARPFVAETIDVAAQARLAAGTLALHQVKPLPLAVTAVEPNTYCHVFTRDHSRYCVETLNDLQPFATTTIALDYSPQETCALSGMLARLLNIGIALTAGEVHSALGPGPWRRFIAPPRIDRDQLFFNTQRSVGWDASRPPAQQTLAAIEPAPTGIRFEFYVVEVDLRSLNSSIAWLGVTKNFDHRSHTRTS